MTQLYHFAADITKLKTKVMRFNLVSYFMITNVL